MKIILVITLIFVVLQSGLKSQYWENVALPSAYAGNYWLDVYFLESDPRYGWVCGYNGAVLRTTNGGQSWEGTTIRGAYQLESIHFANKDIGYTSGLGELAGGVIYKSTDGGRTWFDITPNGSNTNLWGNFFITPNIGLVIGGGCNDFQHFYRTTDGGLTWSLFRANVPNTGLCDLILYDANGLGYASSSGRIWRTTDGGRTWSIFSISGREDWQEEITHQGNTFIVPFSQGCTGGGSGGIRSSNDLGKTWREFRTGVPMFGAFLHDSLRGWACGHNGKVYFTNDGGRSWFLQPCGLNGRDMDDIWFIDDTTGFVVGAGIYRYRVSKTIKPSITASSDTLYCPGDSIILSVDKIYPMYKWSTGETTRSIIVRNPGSYWVYAYIDTCNYGLSESITIYQRPKPNLTLSIHSKNPLCEGDTAVITVNEDFKSYLWINGSNSKSIEVFQSGKYSVSVIDEYDCIWTAEIDVNFLPNPKPKIDIIGKKNFCEGDTTILTTTGFSSKWYQVGIEQPIASQTNTLFVTKSGKYFVISENSNGCINISDTVDIVVRQDSNQLSLIIEGETKSISFGNIKIRNLSCKNFTIRNNTSQNIELNNIILFRNLYFSIPQSTLPIIIQPYSTINAIVCFHPTVAKELKDTIFIPDICNDHFISLIGEGVEIIYDGQSRCGLPIRLTEKGTEVPVINISQPYPNPSNSLTHFDISFQGDFQFLQDLDIDLYNHIGEQINIKPQITLINKESESQVYTCKFSFDISNLSNGIYYLILKYFEYTKTIPIIKE